MALEIGEHEREGVTVLALKGRITVGEVTPVREKITQLVAAGHNQIVLDLEHVDLGLHELEQALEALTRLRLLEQSLLVGELEAQRAGEPDAGPTSRYPGDLTS